MRTVLLAVSLVSVAASARAETLYVDREIGAACADYDPAARACGAGIARAFPTIQGSFGALAPGGVFFVDILGHAADPGVAPALEELARVAGLFRVLGAYPRGV